VPIMTLTTQLSGSAGFTDSYPKPALGYLYVKDMLGDSLFFKALHHYIATWNGKHPMPYDFFNCMNVGAGVDMNWFWKRWFFDDGIPDLAIANVLTKGKNKQIVIESKGIKPVPIDLTIVYTDGSKETIHRTVAVWKDNNKTVDVMMKNSKTIKSVTLGSIYAADSNKKDNVWGAK
jgi:aminopeptidase N